MNNAGSRMPESDAVFGAGGFQKIVNFLVQVFGAFEILIAADLGFDQMVAVDRGRDCDLKID